MYMANKTDVRGIVFIETIEKINGIWRITGVKKYTNLITNSGKDLLAYWLYSGTAIDVYKIGIGTGTTAVSASDTSIEDEIFRISYDSTTRVGNKIYYYFYVAPDEANATWGNVGLITTDGTLFSHTNCTESKTSSVAKNITYIIEF